MPPMKIQPIDSPTYRESSIRTDAAKPVLKSRLKRLFDLQFPNVLRISSVEKITTAGEAQNDKDGVATMELFEPSSVCLAKMVQNFIEETNEKQPAQKCGRNRCNCFNGNINDISDDEFDISTGFGDSIPSSWFGDFSDTIKSLIQCASVAERNLLADTSKIIENNKICMRKDDLRTILTDGLLFLGYNASICKSRWEKTLSFPAGEYEYIDVIMEGEERVLIDIDFRSEFEIARPTGNYKAILQSLPFIFVGRADRLQQIVSIVSEAAKQSLKKKGLHIPPWRKAEYMRAKWLSPHTRTTPPNDAVKETVEQSKTENKQCSVECDCGELDLIFGQKVDATETSKSECQTKNHTAGNWEAMELISRDGQTKLKAQVFFASFDQCSDKAAGESACTALVAVITHWLQSNQDRMPTGTEFNTLIIEGSSEWRKLCDNEAVVNNFPDKHFDLETVLHAGLRPVSVSHEKSFVGFLGPEKFEALKGTMSFDEIWNEISNMEGENEPRNYIVSWNDHFFVLKVDEGAYYIIDTLGERLFEGCKQAYILKFDNSTVMLGKKREGTVHAEEIEGTETIDSKECEEVICKGKDCCREFIKKFLAGILLRELESEEEKEPVSYYSLHQRLQIEFNFSSPQSSLLSSPLSSLSSSPTISISSLFSNED